MYIVQLDTQSICNCCCFDTDLDESLNMFKCKECGKMVCELCINDNGLCDDCNELIDYIEDFSWRKFKIEMAGLEIVE